jgi:hypothetical protein
MWSKAVRRLTRGTAAALALPVLLLATTAAAAPQLSLDGSGKFCLATHAASHLRNAGITMQPAGNAKIDPTRPECLILPFAGATLAPDLSEGGADLGGSINFTRGLQVLNLTHIHADIARGTITADATVNGTPHPGVAMTTFTVDTDRISLTPTSVHVTDLPMPLTLAGQDIFTSAFADSPAAAPETFFETSGEGHLAAGLPRLP